MIQQKKRNKENFQIPKNSKSKMIDGISPNHLATTPHFFNPTPGVLLWTIDSSWAFDRP